MKILSHDLNDGPLIGDRESLLNEIDNLSCSSSSNRQNAFDDLTPHASGTSHEKQVFIISFCSSDNNDDTEILIFNDGIK